MDIEKYLSSFMKGYTETDFGYYTNNEDTPNFYDGNALRVEKETDSLIDVLRSHNFRKVKAPKAFFEKYGIDYEEEVEAVMKYQNFITGTNPYLDYKIEKLSENNYAKYKAFDEHAQLSDYKEIFNPVETDILTQDYMDVYMILNGDKIVARFELYENKVIESVFCDKAYRKQGIMRNFLSYVANNREVFLFCDESVIPFYEKCGYVVFEKSASYVKYIKNSEEILEKIL